jgi:hypothetical protein
VLKAEDGDGYTYQWKTYVSMIVDSVSDDCGKKSDIDDCPVPPGACDSNFVYRRVPILHYLPPGMGFQHFSIRDPKVKLWYFITGAAATSLGVGIYKKIESRRYYDQHLAATTLERLDSDYEKANSRHHEFLIYTGASMLIWGATNTLVFIKDQQNKKLFETRFGCDDRNVFNFQPQEHYLSLCLLPSYSGNPNDLAESLGLGVRYRLQF